MRNILCLPSSLLLLLATSTWSTASGNVVIKPQARARGATDVEMGKTGQHAGIIGKRDDAILRRMLGEVPVAVKKMSTDPEEKFFPEYWQFNVEQSVSGEVGEYANGSILTIQPLPPLLRHSDDFFTPFSKLRNFPRNIFEKRDYKCPTGTNSCSSIGYPYSCCATDQTCMVITDTGIGSVGCCPSGQTCGGSVSSCNTAQGYNSCPGSSNGGCCIPGYTCDSVGCVASSIITATGSLSMTTIQAVTTVATTIVATTTVITSYNQIVTTATVILTEVVIITTSSSIAISTVYLTTTTPTSTAYIGISTAQTTIYTTITQAVPPVRPTSDSSSVTLTTITTTTTTTGVSAPTSIAGICPTGFYQCSAYYDGGCCRVGLNCDTSSCPSSGGSTVVVVGSVVTIIVGTGYGVTTVVTGNSPVATTVVSTVSASTTTTTTTTPTSTTPTSVAVITASTTTVNAASGGATCAVGWYSCDASNGGGCCPSGYSCAASCVATQSGEPGHVYKVPANQATSASIDGLTVWFLASVGVMVGSGMLFC